MKNARTFILISGYQIPILNFLVYMLFKEFEENV